jgi:hypothetical protein
MNTIQAGIIQIGIWGKNCFLISIINNDWNMDTHETNIKAKR